MKLIDVSDYRIVLQGQELSFGNFLLKRKEEEEMAEQLACLQTFYESVSFKLRMFIVTMRLLSFILL